MAKQVSELFIKLGIQGEQELSALKSSFNELSKVTKLSETDLNSIRTRLVEFGREAGNTERVNRGLTDAFRGLLSEASRGSAIWQQLNSDLSKLRQEARLSDTELNALRDVILKEAKAHTQSAASIKDHIKSLQDLKNQASLNGKLYGELSADIQKLTATLDESTAGNRKHYSSLTAILAVKPDAVLNQWRNYTRILDEGTASAEKLAVAQRRLNQLSGAPRILARRRIAESAAVTQDPEYLRRFGFEGASLPELPNTNAAYAQQIKELQQDLANLDRTSVAYLQTVMQLAGVQRQATEVTRGYAQALLLGLNTNTVERSTRNLQEVITALRAEMQQLDVTTTEGAASYAKNANQVRNLEQELNKLANSYKHVGDMASQAATAQQSAAGRSYVSNYLNRSAVRQQEAAYAELSQRIQQGVTGTPLMLPAAGQTSAPGTGLAYSGGARVGRATGAVQQIFAPGSGVGGVRFPGEAEKLQPTVSAEAADRAKRSYVSEVEARRAAAEAAQQQEQYINNLRAAVDKATQSNTGSINSLNTLRNNLVKLREELAPTSADFKQYTGQLAETDRQLERINATKGKRFSGMQFAQAAGAVVSGGIFGGPEGFLGGLVGSAFGGVGGAFAGAAIGGQASIIRQQLAAVADYNAQLNLAKTTLGQVSVNQEDYNRRLALARQISKDYTLGLRETITSYAQVAAAASANNLTFKETETIYRGVVSAAVAFGKSQADIDAIVTATTQVLSKGKISAEELQGQIGERLPGAVARFAEATGRSLPELAKDLQDGKVNIKDFVDYTRSQVTDYDKLAKLIGSSPEKAGARLKLALDRAAETYGGFLQRVGASLQDLLTTIVNWFNDNETAIKRWIYLIYVAGKAVYDFGASVKSVADGVTTYVTRIASVVLPVVSQLLTAADAYAKITGKPVQLGAGIQFNKATAGYAEFWKGMEFKPPQFGGGTPGVTAAPLGETPEQKRLREQRERDAQVAAEQAQRRNEEIAKQQIRLADNVFKYQMELEERRYQRRKELADLNAQNELRLLFGTERERAAADLRYRQSVEQFDRQIADARREVARQEQALRSAKQIAAVTAGGTGTAAGTLLQQGTGFTSQQLTAATSAAAKFTGVANMCAESVKAFYASLGISLPGVTAWADTVQKAGTVMRDWSKLMPGDIVATGRPGDTPHVGVYTGGSNVFHQSRSRGLRAGNFPDLNYFRGGYFVRPTAAGRQRAAVAAQQNRAIADVGDIDMAQLGLQQAQRTLADLLAERPGFQKAAETTRVLDYSEAVKQQNVELDKELRLLRQRVDLQTQGYTEAYIELQLKVNENTREQAKLEAELLNAEPSKRDAITAALEGLREELRIRRDIYDLQERTKQGFGFREGAKQYVESLGSMKEATSQLTLNGIKGLEDALMDLATTGSANFASFAAEVLKQGARMILQQLVLKPLIQGLANLFNPGAAAASASGFDLNLMESYASGGFAKGAAFASNGIVPYAMGGIVDKPTLFRFANGGVPSTGLMGEAGPEAIIPLRRGSDGKLGVAGGGSTSITINVDAKGSSAEGDPGRAAALGRVITAAVQAELVKQKRPGGLLSR